MNPVKLITPATLLPVSLQEAKDHLRVTVDDEDALIEAYLRAAIQRIEDYRQSNIMDATYELHCRGWQYLVNLQKNPVSAINSVKYYNEAGTLETITPSDYRLLDMRVPAVLEFINDFDGPTTQEREYPIVVNFQSGYLAASSVTPTIKAAIFIELGTLNEIRQGEAVGNGLTVVQMKNASTQMIDAESMWL